MYLLGAEAIMVASMTVKYKNTTRHNTAWTIIKNCHANSVITGAAWHNNNIQWRQSWYHDNSRFSVMWLSFGCTCDVLRLTISCHMTCRVLLGEEGMELDDAIGQLDLDIHALFCQMDVLCHFDDGESGWKEAARSVLCVCLSNRARHPGGHYWGYYPGNLSCTKVC